MSLRSGRMEEGLQSPQATRWANPRTLSSCLGNGACQPKPGPVAAVAQAESLIRNLRRWSRIFAPRIAAEVFAMTRRIHVPAGFRLVFRTTRTDPRTGQVLHARAYGLRAWPILVPE
jgi:hypothetical protein